MKKIIIGLLLLVTCLGLKSQTFQGNNNYVLIADEDTSVYFLTKKQAIVTSAQAVGKIAFAVDSVQIFETIEQYNLQFPILPDTGQVKRGEIYFYNSEVLRVIQSHNRSTVAHYNPHDVPALYLFRPVSGCQEWVQPTGAHDAYNVGDCITYKGDKYESVINANVWNPETYPAGWKKL
jgi:hypothetical protein